MAKRAKRAVRPNPRQDRNVSTFNKNNENVIELEFAKTRSRKRRVEIVPRNLSQENYVAALEDASKHIVFAIGPAGTGKTMLATQMAIRQLRDGAIDRIVITRPNVAVDDRDIGYLPGDIMKKMAPWMMPILDVFSEYYSQAEIEEMIEENIIEMVPIAFIRGRTFKNCWILVDEAQGTTPNSMLSILTRIGENSKMIVTGDLAQSDRGRDNGLADFLNRFNNSKQIEVIRFAQRDVERHPVVMELLEIYKDRPVV